MCVLSVLISRMYGTSIGTIRMAAICLEERVCDVLLSSRPRTICRYKSLDLCFRILHYIVTAIIEHILGRFRTPAISHVGSPCPTPQTSFFTASIANGATSSFRSASSSILNRARERKPSRGDVHKYNRTAPTIIFCIDRAASASASLISWSVSCGGAARGSVDGYKAMEDILTAPEHDCGFSSVWRL